MANVMMPPRLGRVGSVLRVRSAMSFCVAACLVGLQGCAGSGLGATPEDIVRERAKSRWDALIAGQWEKAYNFSTPAYRNAVDLFGFRLRAGSPPGRLTGAEIVGVKCEESSCDATVRLSFFPLKSGFPELTAEHSERWVFSDGGWWRFEKY